MTTEKGKAIFVDGPSANSMKAALGINLVSYQGLYRVLCKIGVCGALTRTPLVTMHPERVAQGEGLCKHLAGAGFDVLPVESRGSADDEAIKECIRRLDPQEVGEVVIMTSDQDFVPVLRQKVSQGIQVYWVSTLRPDPKKGRHALSSSVISLFQSGVFSFVELAKFSRQITLKRPSAVASNCYVPSDDSLTVITLRLRSDRPADHMRLASEIANLKKRFSGLTFTVEV